jgi:hypothetical protein
MLHQISWLTYAVSIISVIIIYYGYVGLNFYNKEFQAAFYKFTGKQPVTKAAGAGDLQIPEHDIMGKVLAEDIDFVSPEELSFAPNDDADEVIVLEPPVKVNNSYLISNFSEMISEVKTLIRVINESEESKENFEMLFRLIIQKYPALAGTPYQQQIIDFLLSEGVPEFPFPLTETDLTNYWTNED